jgi:hypothetical protein
LFDELKALTQHPAASREVGGVNPDLLRTPLRYRRFEMA